jgi:hypothetical protein
MASDNQDKKPEKGTTKPKAGKGRTLEEALALMRGDSSKHTKAY